MYTDGYDDDDEEDDSPGGDVFPPGQFTNIFTCRAVEHKLPEIAEMLREFVEIIINGLREDSKFTSKKKPHIIELLTNLQRYNDDLELATLEIFRACHYAELEELDDETAYNLDTLNEMAFDARSDLTMLYMFTKQKLTEFLAITNEDDFHEHMLKLHTTLIPATYDDFISQTNHIEKLKRKANEN